MKLYTDSSYVRDGITKWVYGWRTAAKQPVKNQDLWQRLLAAVQRHEPAGGVTWHWLNGHAGDDDNERVDDLANAAARSVTDDDPVDEAGDGPGETPAFL